MTIIFHALLVNTLDIIGHRPNLDAEFFLEQELEERGGLKPSILEGYRWYLLYKELNDFRRT